MNKKSATTEGRMWVCLALGVALVLGAANTQAQMGRGMGSRLTPDEAAAAWALQAGQVAHKLDISKDNADKLAAAYAKARTDFAAAVQGKRQEAGRSAESGRDRMMAYRKLRTELSAAHREKLEQAVSAFLTEEQAREAVALLGSFNTRWDHMVHTLAGLELGDKQDQALGLVNDYVLKQAKALQALQGSGDYSQMRDQFTTMKADLDKALAAVLSAEQLAKWQEATAMRRPGGPGGRQGRRRDGSGSESGSESKQEQQ